jgi:hypothetical protein
MGTVFHALVLNLHQPAGNLEALLASKEWEAKEILYAMDRIPRSLWSYEDVGRVHLSLSGTLLETLAGPDFQERVQGMVKCGELLWHLQNGRIIQILGTGYYHPILPLIPAADWEAQLGRWLGIGRHLFWRPHFPGFWPPEMGFCMELIPTLKGMLSTSRCSNSRAGARPTSAPFSLMTISNSMGRTVRCASGPEPGTRAGTAASVSPNGPGRKRRRML